jgi:phosphoglucomutase
MAHELAGKLPPPSLLIDVAALERAYFEPVDGTDVSQKVAFGTSGHRGSALLRSFNEAHIVAITQATCEYRAAQNISGPLFLGKDSHALSPLAERTALEVLAANGVETVVQGGAGLSPTPAISRAILAHNADPGARRADGLIITPSHNPPADGGIKYNPPQGGPADTDVTGWIERRANELLTTGNAGVKRVAYASARSAGTTHERDLITPYVMALDRVIDMKAIQDANIHAAVDPLGGTALPYWEQIADYWKLDLTIVNRRLDPRFDFMTVDHDGKIRMDCSSPYAMASLVALKDRYALAFGNDADADRHGIVAPSVGLLNPNHYLAVAIEFLVKHRPQWSASLAIGKTLVSSAIIDRVVNTLGRRLYEVPVGFKWFSGGLFDGTLAFGGEESAGASFLCHDGSAWCTDKDGLILCLLGLEMLAKTGSDPGVLYQQIEQRLGKPTYRRVDAAANAAQKAKLKSLKPSDITSTTLAGEQIEAVVSHAPGNNAALGGIKVLTKNAWFAARPSGTEDLYKIYAESFRGETHLQQVLEEAQQVVDRALA